jgi:hypothetical protein
VALLYQNYFQDDSIIGSKYFRWRLICNVNFIQIMLYPCVVMWLNNFNGNIGFECGSMSLYT